MPNAEALPSPAQVYATIPTLMATAAPHPGSSFERFQRGVHNLHSHPRFISQVTGAPLVRVLPFYFHPNALRLARELERSLAPFARQKWFVGGVTFMEGLTMYAVTRLARPQRAVELGVANGVLSAYVL